MTSRSYTSAVLPIRIQQHVCSSGKNDHPSYNYLHCMLLQFRRKTNRFQSEVEEREAHAINHGRHRQVFRPFIINPLTKLQLNALNRLMFFFLPLVSTKVNDQWIRNWMTGIHMVTVLESDHRRLSIDFNIAVASRHLFHLSHKAIEIKRTLKFRKYFSTTTKTIFFVFSLL